MTETAITKFSHATTFSRTVSDCVGPFLFFAARFLFTSAITTQNTAPPPCCLLPSTALLWRSPGRLLMTSFSANTKPPFINWWLNLQFTNYTTTVNLTLLPATVFFCDVYRQRGGEIPPGISGVLEHIARKFQRLPLHFRGHAF